MRVSPAGYQRRVDIAAIKFQSSVTISLLSTFSEKKKPEIGYGIPDVQNQVLPFSCHFLSVASFWVKKRRPIIVSALATT